MARTWLSITVELVEGQGKYLWPRPGRIFIAARSHTFSRLAEAIDAAFARWDLGHLHEFHFPNSNDPKDSYERVGIPDPDFDDVTDMSATKLSRLNPGQQFAYVFDLGDDWTHLCTVAEQRVDPIEVYGIVPQRPTAYRGWGSIPDQYGRRYDGDTGHDEIPPDPNGTDLPPLYPSWGPRANRPNANEHLAP